MVGMASVAILVNGLPGSGKTTLSATLAGVLGCPLLAKDPVKEALADLAGPMIDPQALGSIAMDTVWAMAAEVEAGVVVDSFWHRPRDLEPARAGVSRAGSPRTLEVWCDVDPDVALQRVVDRLAAGGRHPAHGTVESTRASWAEWAEAAAPLGEWPVLRVDTSTPVDVDDLVMKISEQFV
jgi:predicted kinase